MSLPPVMQPSQPTVSKAPAQDLKYFYKSLYELSKVQIKIKIENNWSKNQRFENLSNVLIFLEQDEEKTNQQKNELINKIANSEIFTLALYNLLQNDPIYFFKIFILLETKQQRKNQMFTLILAKKDEIFNTLTDACQELIFSETTLAFQRLALNSLLSSLEPKELETLNATTIEMVDADTLGSLSGLLHPTYMSKCFYKEKQDTESLANYISGIADVIDLDDPKCPTVLIYILHLLDLQELKEVYEFVFYKNEPLTHACFLWSAPINQFDDLIEEIIKDLSPSEYITLINTYLILEKQTYARLISIGQFFNKISDEDFFFDCLHELIETKSKAIPYLFTVLSEQHFTLLHLTSPHLRTELLGLALPKTKRDYTIITSNLKKNTTRLNTLCNQMVLDIISQEPIMENGILVGKQMTLLDIGLFIQNNKIDDFKAFIEGFQNDLHKIPAFLLGLSTYTSLHRKWIFRVSHYLSNEQLKALAFNIPAPNIPAALEKLAGILSLDQFNCVWESLNKKNQIVYLVQKSKELNNKYDEAVKKIQQTKKSFFSLTINKNIKNFKEKINETYDTAQKIVSLLRFITKPHHLIITKKTIDSKYQKSILNQINASCKGIKFLTKQNSIISQLSILKSSLSDKQEENISDFYWSKLTLNSLTHLGVVHAGKLMELGIKSDKDFQLLGLSKDKLFNLDKICMFINQLAKQTQSTDILLKKKWDAAIQAKLSGNMNLQTFKNELYEVIEISSISKERFATFLQHISESTTGKLSKSRIKHQIELINKSENEEKFLKLKKKIITALINYVLKGNFLIRLQTYLKQTNTLKEIWQNFQKKNIHSLSDLKNQKITTNFLELFKLKRL